MNLYNSPPPILTWVPQGRLAFGQTPHEGWLSDFWPSAITIQQCVALLAAAGYDWPCGLIESLILLSRARCLIVSPYDNSFLLFYRVFVINIHLVKNK